MNELEYVVPTVLITTRLSPDTIKVCGRGARGTWRFCFRETRFDGILLCKEPRPEVQWETLLSVKVFTTTLLLQYAWVLDHQFRLGREYVES